MLKPRSVATRLPAQDLNRARAFYADKLGLEPSEVRPGGLLYRCAGSEFALFESAGASSGTFTQMGWTVDDIEESLQGGEREMNICTKRGEEAVQKGKVGGERGR